MNDQEDVLDPTNEPVEAPVQTTQAAPIQTAAPQPTSLASRMITVMSKGWLDDTPDLVRAPTTSRQWKNRKAKAEADRFLTNPQADVSTIDFDNIWGHVLRAEGGYANDPNDPGGETKFGISKRAHPHLDIGSITSDQAKEIFKADYYDSVGGDVIMKINPGLAAHVSDMAFNAGPKAAIKLMYDAVGLPRESQITPELIDKLSEGENLVKDYSVARLKYYAGLGNASTYIKGWTNRVNNLNKALKVTSGLNGAYKAARSLDVDALVQHAWSAEDQLASRFAELNQQEIDRLRNANEMLSPLYKKRTGLPPIKGDKSSLGEVFKATYDAKYYTNTVDGLNELTRRSVTEASEANRKALGDKFDKSIIEKMTFGLYGGIDNIEEWEAEVADFKKKNPDVTLPFEKASQVYALTHKKAQDIETRYDSLDSGSFKDGISASLSKLGHIVAGYLPGEILGSMSDRIEGAVNALPIPGVSTAAGIAKGAAAVMAGTGASQALVQPKRQEVGLEGGLKEGLANTAMAGIGQGVLGSLAGIATKLWNAGSKEAAKETFKAVNNIKKAIASEIPTADGQHILREALTVENLAKELDRNPYGDSFEAKMLYEKNREGVMDDLINDRPVRELEAPVNNVIDNTTKLREQAKFYAMEMDDPDAYLAVHQKGIDEWNKFKQSRAKPDAVASLDNIDAVPQYREPSAPEHAAYINQLQTYMNNKLTDLDKRYEQTLKGLELKDPLTALDFGDSAEQVQSVGTVLKEFNDTRTGLSEMFSCMVGGPSTTQGA